MRRSLIVACIVLVGHWPAAAQTVPTGVDRIEEDWQVVVGDPDTVTSGPQVTTVMSPVSDGSEPSVALNFNYRQSPTLPAGGAAPPTSGESARDVGGDQNCGSWPRLTARATKKAPVPNRRNGMLIMSRML